MVKPTLPTDKLKNFCERHHILSMALFGSILTKHFGPQSDIDLLVEFDSKHIPTLFDIVDMEAELTDILGRPADLRTPKDLSPYFRQEVLKTAQPIYVKS